MTDGVSPEEELRWAQQDLRIAGDNLDAAKRRLEEAEEEWSIAFEVRNAAKKAVQDG